MRALRVAGPGAIAVVDRPLPLARDASETVVRPLLVGLCGTDLEILDGMVDPAYVRYPLTLGHEWVGELTVDLQHAAGGGPLAAGTRVVVEGIVPCRACEHCARGETNLCLHYDELGFTRDGAAAGAVVVPSASVHALPVDVPLESAVLVEPAAVAHRALGRARPRPGADILVIGDGTIGLLAARLARWHAPRRVDVLGRRPEQAALAAAMGADAFLVGAHRGPAAPDRAYDLVVVAAGGVDAVSAARSAVRRGGTVVIVGFSGRGRTLALGIDDLVNDDVALVGSYAYTRDSWSSVVGRLGSELSDLGVLVTHRFPLERHAEALAAVRSATGLRGKVVLDPVHPAT